MKSKINKKMNKKADVPVTILVIGVFAVCTLALLSFMYSSNKLNKSLDGIKLMEEANAKIEKGNLNYLYLDKKEKRLDIGSDEEGFSLFKEKIIFSLEYTP